MTPIRARAARTVIVLDNSTSMLAPALADANLHVVVLAPGDLDTFEARRRVMAQRIVVNNYEPHRVPGRRRRPRHRHPVAREHPGDRHHARVPGQHDCQTDLDGHHGLQVARASNGLHAGTTTVRRA
jgi:hypothetical protein